MRNFKTLLALVLMLGLYGFSFAQHEHTKVDMEALGKVNFSISCSPAAQEQFNRGVALLHHMMYVQAQTEFEAAAETDPNCAMAHWGVGMTLFQPLWAGQPSPEALQKGREAVELAKSLNPETEREKAYIAALEAFYQDPEATYPARLQAFEQGMENVYTSYPNDLDAAAFYALSHLATASSTDKTLAHQNRAAEILDAVRAEEPTHPGAIHYAIHAHDVPPLASQASDIARGYDQIAPEVPHALHMPSHIFVRLGEWPDVISWNLRSAEAALGLEGDTILSLHYPHGMDYVMYAYLQQAADEEALGVLQEVSTKENYQNHFAIAYALTAIPARYALERRQWQEAAGLKARESSAISWDNFPEVEAITHFARGIGAARSGDIDTAREALQTLEALHKSTAEAGRDYWAQQIEIQRLAVAAWLAHAQGNDEEALALMQVSADLEDATEKHAVTPGAVLPARELLGDLLLELNRPVEAMEAYEASLELSPNRLNSLLGMGRAAELSGDPQEAKSHYSRLMEMAGESERPDLEEVRVFLGQN